MVLEHVLNRGGYMKTFLQSLLPGLKHYLFAILAVVLPNVNSWVETFVATHPGWTGALVAALLVFLKQVTKPALPPA